MKKILFTSFILFLAGLSFAAYTRVVRGNSVNATVTSTPKSLKQLMIDAGLSASEAPQKGVNRILMSFEGNPASPAIIVRFANDPNATISSGVGRAILSLEERVFTPDQFDSIFIAEGADVDVFIEQYNYEQDKL